MRTVASQMKDAVGQSVSVRIGGAGVRRPRRRVLRVRPGDHLPRLPQGVRRGHRRRQAQRRRPGAAARPARGRPGLRRLAQRASGHETKPPARYTEATLIKELEDREIGRPSTYASIIGTILNRGYVYKKGTALVPAWLAFSVIRLLEEHFPRQIVLRVHRRHGGRARRDRRRPQGPQHRARRVLLRLRRVEGLHDAGRQPRRDRRPRAGDVPDRRARAPASTCGSAATAPTSRAPTTRATRPASGPTSPTTCRPTSSRSRRPRSCSRTRPARRSSSAATRRPGWRSWRRTAATAPTSPRCCPRTRPRSAKPRTGSLFKSMSLDTITLDDALKLLSLPRVVGADAGAARRSPPRTAATGPTSRRAPTPGR